MRRWHTRSRPRASAAAAAVLVLGLAGCVTKGTYDRVSDERDSLAADKRRLEERVKLLEASNEALGSERVALIDEMEDLRQAREDLSRNVRKLQRREADLAEGLAARESELAAQREELARLTGTYEDLVADLESEVASGQIQIEQLREGIRLNLPEDVLFASGSAQLNPVGREVVRRVAERLRELPHFVEVQGHTDDVPLRPSQVFPSNWELAARRATEVVRLLQSAGVSPERLSAVSFGPYQPVASNDDPAGRARNRRIEIRLEPPPAGAAPPGTPETAPAGGS